MTGDVGVSVVFGGSGFIGAHLTGALSEAGHSVIVADIQPPRGLPPGASYEPVDVRREIGLRTDRPPHRVYNLAAVHRTPGHADHEYYDTNVAGARNVVNWCERVGAGTLTLTSSISVYGPGEDAKDERARLRPDSAYGRSKTLAEQIHQDWASRGNGRLVITRPAVVFGPGEGGNFTRLAGALRRRRFAYPGRDDTVKGCGYVSDLLRAVEFAIDQEEAQLIFNYCYPVPYTIADICDAFSRVAGYPQPKRVPQPMVRAALRTLNAVPGRRRLGPLDPARVNKLVESTNIIPAELVRRGFRWETDLESALHAWLDADPAGVFV